MIQDLPGPLSPTCCVAALAQQAGQQQQARGLTDQVIVGTGKERHMAIQIVGMLRQAVGQRDPIVFAPAVPIGQGGDHPDPGNTPHRNFQGAGPIHPLVPRILLDPADHQTPRQLGRGRIATDEPGLGQGYQELVSIQLPDIFDIDVTGQFVDGQIRVKLKWPTEFGQRVPMPVDAAGGTERRLGSQDLQGSTMDPLSLPLFGLLQSVVVITTFGAQAVQF